MYQIFSTNCYNTKYDYITWKLLLGTVIDVQHKARAWNMLGLSAWIIKERRNNIKINYVKGTERRDSEISFYFICINTHCQRISWMTHTFTFVINAGASCLPANRLETICGFPYGISLVHGQIITIIAYCFVERLIQQLLNYNRLHREFSIAEGCLAVISGRARAHRAASCSGVQLL